MAKILVVDDDELFRELLCSAVERQGHIPLPSGTLAMARSILEREGADLAYLDVRLPDGCGIEALDGLRSVPDPPEVIIVTGQGDPDGAELALRCGAWDYIEKPASMDRMILPMLRALAYRAEKRKRVIPSLSPSSGIIGHSTRFAACLAQAAVAAASGADVLITGETGTGKEVFARAIHASGDRAKNRLVVVDCTTLPGTLAESVLFGHERGSFTGADRRQAGLIELADGGTLFLDEVGELPLSIQAKFLRVLQERSYRPVGGGKHLKSDFRLVAATNRDLPGMVARGEFRHDLLFRLGAFSINLPPLRDREGDVEALVRARLTRFATDAGAPAKEPSPEYLELLVAHRWPGNVRELFQAVDMSLVSALGEQVLLPQHLPLDLRVQMMRHQVSARSGMVLVSSLQADPADLPARLPAEAAAAALPAAVSPAAAAIPDTKSLPPWREHRGRILDAAEQAYFSALVARTGGDPGLAASVSGLKTARLYELLGKHGLVKGRRAGDIPGKAE